MRCMMEKRSSKCQKTQSEIASRRPPEAKFRDYWCVLLSRKEIVLRGFLILLHLWSAYSISDAATINENLVLIFTAACPLLFP